MERRASAAPARSRPARPAPARPRLAIAPEVARRRLRARLLVAGSALVTVLSMFMLVAFHVLAAQSAFTLQRLDKERANEQLRYERLREQVAINSSAQAVIAAATKLGMVPGSQVVPLEVAAVVPTTAVPAGSVPILLSPKSYAQTKQALDPNP